MKKQLYLLLLFLVLSSQTLAQIDSAVGHAESQPSKFSFMLRVGLRGGGTEFIFIPSMKNYLQKRNLNSIDNSILEGSVFDIGWRWKDWFFMINNSISNVSRSGGPRSFSFNLWLERTLFKDRNYRINLYGGIGGCDYTFTLRNSKQYSGKTYSLNDLPQTTFAISPEISLSSVVSDIGMVVLRRERNRNNFDYAFRVGYRRAWRSQAWQFANPSMTLLDAPQDRFSAIYLHGTIGISRNGRLFPRS